MGGGEETTTKFITIKFQWWMTPYKFLQVLRFGKSESSQTNCQKYGQRGPSTLMILTPY